jgi:cell division protein FtsB
MPVVTRQAEKSATEPPATLRERALGWLRRAWRPAASVAAVTIAFVLVWQGISGKNGLLMWREKQAEDRELQKEIDALNQENARLRQRVEQLNSNPDAINQVAREQLHYAKPNEVIVQLPPEKKPPEQLIGSGK